MLQQNFLQLRSKQHATHQHTICKIIAQLVKATTMKADLLQIEKTSAHKYGIRLPCMDALRFTEC